MRRRLMLIALAVAAALAVALVVLVRDRALRAERHELRAMLGGAGMAGPQRVADDSTAFLVRRYYRARGYRPAWTDGIAPQPAVRELIDVLAMAPAEGLDPGDYAVARVRELLARAPKPDDPARAARLAELDARLTAGFLRYASDLLDGRVDPRRLPTDWLSHPRRASLLELLDQALRRHRVPETLAALPPPHRGYALLRSALADYRAIAARGGWPAVPPGPPLARGARGGRVRALAARLVATGDLAPPAAPGDRFDARLVRALRAFQARHGLDTTGRVGADDLAALDVPVEERIREIELNLERWRWLPDTLGAQAIVVNIPEFMLRVLAAGRPVLEMRVVVGKDVSSTPVFSDTISRIVFGPAWSIPPRIVVDEIAPALRADPGYLARTHIRVFTDSAPDGREVNPATLDLADTTALAALAFRQDPGPGNALGHVKFVCPNRFNVYLHDTPAGELFGLRERNFSHGCIRVERPAVLAAYLLRGMERWPPERIASAMDSARGVVVTLPHPTPVHILYWTAWVDDRGALEFRRDIYGLDPLTYQALGRHERAVTRESAALAARARAAGRPSQPPHGTGSHRRKHRGPGSGKH